MSDVAQVMFYLYLIVAWLLVCDSLKSYATERSVDVMKQFNGVPFSKSFEDFLSKCLQKQPEYARACCLHSIDMLIASC